MNTLRSWLNENGFDWKYGEIVISVYDETLDEFVKYHGYCNDYSDVNELLDRRFRVGFGEYGTPCMFASDIEKIYFISDYDGHTSMKTMFKDARRYLDPNVHLGYF